MTESAGWMLIGRVQGAFGVRGEMKVALHTDFPDRFKSLQRVFVGLDRAPYEVERSRRHGGQILLKLAGIDSPERVRELGQADVLVPREEAVTLPEGHYYLDDLVGMTVLTTDGAAVGTITDVLQTGSNDVLVVNRGKDAVLIPALKDAIPTFDPDAGRVIVEPWALVRRD